jgi:N-acyl-D-amino-acid deacylase
VEIWHLKVSGSRNWGRMGQVLARLEAARAEGVDISANMYPYEASSNGLDNNLPDWAEAGGVDQMIARLHDPAQREKIKAALWKGGMGDEKPQQILVVDVINPALKRFCGKRIPEIAKEWGKSNEDTLLDLVEQDRANVTVVRFGMSEDDVQLALRQPWIALGSDTPGQALDGPFAQVLAHPRGFGSFPRWIGHYGRELKLFTLEEGVRRITSLPARKLHLWDRGLLRPGMAADVVVDPAAIKDTATYQKPLSYAQGVETVIVGGKVVLDAGKLTAERPGKPVRRSVP